MDSVSTKDWYVFKRAGLDPLPQAATMIKRVILVGIVAWTSNASAGLLWTTNVPECILGNMPGTQNNHEAQDIYWACYRRYGNGTVRKKSPLFGVKNRSQCIAKYGKNTESQTATDDIREACSALYNFN